MAKQNLSSWLSRMVYMGTLTAAVTVISFGAAWGGSKLKIWNYFRNSKPPASSETIDRHRPDERTQEPASEEDSTSTSLVTGSASTNRLEGNPQTELTTLTEAESYAEYEIRKREGLIRDIESLISTSNSKTAEIESDWNYLKSTGFSEEVIRIDSTFNLFAVEESIRHEHRAQIELLQNEITEYKTNPREPTEDEKQKQKNEILLQRISFKEDRIREINLLITKSHSITHEREAEWKSTLTALRANGIRQQIIRAHPAFKKLETDKVQVLAGEQASRTKYRAKVRLLKQQIEKDKKNIR